MATGTFTITLFGGPADGRVMVGPGDADFIDYAVKHGKPLFDPHGRTSWTTHRYWIHRMHDDQNAGQVMALHAGAVSYKREDSQPERQDEDA